MLFSVWGSYNLSYSLLCIPATIPSIAGVKSEGSRD